MISVISDRVSKCEARYYHVMGINNGIRVYLIYNPDLDTIEVATLGRADRPRIANVFLNLNYGRDVKLLRVAGHLL